MQRGCRIFWLTQLIYPENGQINAIFGQNCEEFIPRAPSQAVKASDWVQKSMNFRVSVAFFAKSDFEATDTTCLWRFRLWWCFSKSRHKKHPPWPKYQGSQKFDRFQTRIYLFLHKITNHKTLENFLKIANNDAHVEVDKDGWIKKLHYQWLSYFFMVSHFTKLLKI